MEAARDAQPSQHFLEAQYPKLHLPKLPFTRACCLPWELWWHWPPPASAWWSWQGSESYALFSSAWWAKADALEVSSSRGIRWDSALFPLLPWGIHNLALHLFAHKVDWFWVFSISSMCHRSCTGMHPLAQLHFPWGTADAGGGGD